MLEVTPASRVEPAPVRYLLHPYLPLGALCLLEGDPGTRKSFVATEIAAAVTRGQSPLDASPIAGLPSRVVVYLNAEDPAPVVKARAARAGGKLAKLHLLTRDDLTPLSDVAAYRQLLERHRPALLVLDPLQAFLGGSGATSPARVRAILAPVVKLAEELGVTILGVRHLTKARGRSTYRGLGSIDFYAAARSVLLVGLSPRSPDTSVLVHLKHSYGPAGRSLEFEIADERVAWLGSSELRAEDLDPPPTRLPNRTALEVACAFLCELLESGPVPARSVVERAAEQGIAKRTLERAKDELGIAVEKVAGKGPGAGRGHWQWALGSGTKTANIANAQGVGGLDPTQGGQGVGKVIKVAKWRS